MKSDRIGLAPRGFRQVLGAFIGRFVCIKGFPLVQVTSARRRTLLVATFTITPKSWFAVDPLRPPMIGDLGRLSPGCRLYVPWASPKYFATVDRGGP